MFVCVGLSAIASVASARADWEIVASTLDANAAGVAGAVWVPNQFNNPAIDATGRVVFRGQIGGAGITTANSKVIVAGVPGSSTVIARDGSPVPGSFPAGYVFNTTTGINGLASSNNVSADGGILVSGNINGPGVLATTDTAMYFVAANGTPSFLVREGDVYPGGGGSTMSGSMSAGSGVQTNNLGECIYATTLLGGDVSGTTNNSALLVYRPSGHRVIWRKGAAAPGFSDGTTMTHDTFGLMLAGGDVEFGATLAGGAVTTSNDKVRVTSVGAAPGALRIWCREGGATGIAGINYKVAGTFNNPSRSLTSSGQIICSVSLEGPAVTPALNDAGIIMDDHGAVSLLVRRGDAVPGVTDGVLSVANFSSVYLTNSGILAYQGVLMNADGTAMSTNSTYVGVRDADGTLHTVVRQGDAVPGLSGVTVGSLNGSTSICVNDAGTVVFSNATLPTGSPTCIFAWDKHNGLRVIAKTGDTNFTGTPANTLSLFGSTGNNGDGGNTAFSANGWLAIRARDSVSSIDAIARIMIAPGVAPCPPDVNDDALVDGLDLGFVMAQWGTLGSADINGDGTVDATDLSAVLAAWGPCQ